TDQTAIDAAKALVDKVTDPTVKTALEQDITKAQNLLDAKNAAIQAEKDRQDAASKAVKELFTNDDTSSNSIKNLTDQTAIDAAKALVDKVTDPTVKTALEQDITKAQNLLDAKNAAIQAEKDRQDAASKAVKELFTNDDTSSNSIKNLTDQTAIDAAKALVDKVTDPTVKAALQQDITKAQNLLDAKNAAIQAEKDRQDAASKAVKELFTNDDTSSDTIKNTTSQSTIDDAKSLVNTVTDPTVKATLEQDIAKAQSILDAQNAALQAESTVKALFNNDDTKGTIKNTTDQAAIDAAQQLVNSVIDPAKKSELQQAVNKAQRQLALGEVTIDTYTIGGNYITGTTKTGVTKVGIYVDGKLIRTAAASNGTYQIYASTAPELQVTGQAFEVAPIATDGTIGLKSNSVVSAKVAPKKIAKPMIDDYFKGTSYITGTVSSEAKKIALYIDGQFVRYGAVTGDTFKIYASDVALMKTEGQTFEVVAVDNLGNEGERASSDVKSKTVKGNVLPNETTTLSTYNTGTVTGDVHMIALYVDGKFVRYGAVTGTDYKVYIYDVPALRIAGTTFEVKALDTAGNILYTSTQIVQ
ncbi:toxin Cry1Ac domain D-VI-related protein, partial [Listeria newyorkensis]|uniref:toxin Cry1Ac domain D-VI-related protein n=1 Tax=Listeria newyorkensis TaxID=1497681 RepID=UPI00051DA00F